MVWATSPGMLRPFNSFLIVLNLEKVHSPEQLMTIKLRNKGLRVRIKWKPLIQGCFFRRDISVIFCWDILVIWHTVVLKFAVTMFIGLYCQTFWLKELNFFRSFQNHFGLCPKKTRSQASDPNVLLWFSFCYPFQSLWGRILCLPVGRVMFTCYSSSWRFYLICLQREQYKPTASTQ